MSDLTIHDQLMEALLVYEDDPYGFVLFAFPWGEESTSLATMAGPEPWQVDLLRAIGTGLLSIDEAIRIAIASGHGIGKSALVSWLILWGMLRKETRGVVTANTETQLRTKTWAELAKWYNLYIGREFYHLTATALFSADKTLSRTWRIDAVPWSEKNTEAFAGLHNQGNRILLIFDEASAIPDIIWEVAYGALTDRNTQIIWFVAGNPTKNSGRFHDAFQPGSSWQTRRVDSRTVSFTNKKEIARWAADYGEDSDFFRVRVKGEFPRVGITEFISYAAVVEAMQREDVHVPEDEPVVLGVDVARYGDDESVLYPRRGRDARSYPFERYQGLSTMELVDKILLCMKRFGIRLVAVDAGGVGGGVVDRLRQLHVEVIEVQFGAKANPTMGTKYANKRAEIWGHMRDFLRGGALPDDKQLLDELTAPQYTVVGEDVIQLERKDAMRTRGVASPNVADALAITFAIDTTFFTAYEDMPGGVILGTDHNSYEGIRTYV